MFVGSEAFLLDNMRAGGVGCISATANINPDGIDALYQNWQGPDAETMQAGLNELRQTMQKYPMIPALKAVAGHFSGWPEFGHVRPPLVDLAADELAALVADLGAIGFKMNIETAQAA